MFAREFTQKTVKMDPNVNLIIIIRSENNSKKL
jgi:hypothetical protein